MPGAEREAGEQWFGVEFVAVLVPLPAVREDPVPEQIPVENFVSPDAFEVSSRVGASRQSTKLGDGLPLDSLTVNAGSTILIVAFHGSLDRKKFRIPRFERLRSLIATDYSSMYFADPVLHLSRSLECGWYAGTMNEDHIAAVVAVTKQTMRTFGTRHVIFTGSSGGAFAAMQASARIPGSLALVFNPRIDLAYRIPEGKPRGPQRNFLKYVMPELAPEGFDGLPAGADWSAPLGGRLSLTRLYSEAQPNKVLYCTNTSDSYHQTNCLPFRSTVSPSQVIEFVEYDAGPRHTPPPVEFFMSMIYAAAKDVNADVWQEQ